MTITQAQARLEHELAFTPAWHKAFFDLRQALTAAGCQQCGQPIAGPGLCASCASGVQEVAVITQVQPCRPCEHLEVRYVDVGSRVWKWRCCDCGHLFERP